MASRSRIREAYDRTPLAALRPLSARAVAGLPVMNRLAAYGEPVEGTPFGRYRLIELLGRSAEVS
jgi:hypothetical protein